MTTGGRLARFRQAQDDPVSGYATALAEMKRGRKTSHWIWYVFPQLESLGRSATARHFGLAGPAEAQAYLGDPVLRGRLGEIADVVRTQLERGVALTELMGGQTDALKLVSSMTLFDHAARDGRETCERGSADVEESELARLVADVLSLAARGGFGRCAHTDTSCEAAEQ